MNASISELLAHGHHHNEWLTLGPIAAGLIAGAAHVLMGPDHIAAVAPLALDRPRRTWLAGMQWGVGHSGGIWVLAALALLTHSALPIDRISAWSERLVGIVLIAVGLWGLRRISRLRIHNHAHKHVTPTGTEHVHQHPHVHVEPVEDTTVHRTRPHRHGHSLFGIGLLHGMAGSSHLLGVLPTLAMPNRASALGYAIAFGIGSILGMGLVAEGLGRAMQLAERRNSPRLVEGIMASCSLSAVGLGVFWLF